MAPVRVLVLGATGNLGLRFIPSLLSHKHTVIAYITIVEGDALNTPSIHRALIAHKCDALICSAGYIVMNPFGTATLPAISEASADAAILAAKETGKPLRAWFLGGMSLLDYPGGTYWLCDYIPVGREHIQTLKMLQSKPVDLIKWSILCPSGMKPAVTTPDLKILEGPRKHDFVVKADVPPVWKESWWKNVPVFGRYVEVMRSFVGNMTTLEENADFWAEDLESGSKEWEFRRVGVMDMAEMRG